MTHSGVATRRSILVVDDDFEFAEELAHALAEHGYHTAPCASGSACLDVLAARRTDVVVTDLRMDGMDGVELCAQIKARYPEMIVMMLTAQTELAAAVAALRAGVLDCVRKPVQVETLAPRDGPPFTPAAVARHDLRGTLAKTAVICTSSPGDGRKSHQRSLAREQADHQ